MNFTFQNNLLLIQDLFFNSSLTLSIINSITNILCLIVFLQKKFRSTSTGFYFSCLSVVDILQSYLVIGFYAQKFNIQIENLSNFLCKFHHYLYSTLPLYPSWILVIIAVDRLISIRFLKYASILNKLKTKVLVVASIIILTSLLNTVAFFLFRFETSENSSISFCTVPKEYLETAHNLLIYNCLISITIVPFLIMTVSNSITTAGLIRSKRRALGTKTNDMTREIKFGTTMISLNILFFIFYVPVCILMMLQENSSYTFTIKEASMFMNDRLYFTFYILVYLRHAHSCLQLFVYLLVNKLFRKEFIKILCKCVRVDSLNVITGSTKKSSQETYTTNQQKSSK
jgi:hypothetical protein